MYVIVYIRTLAAETWKWVAASGSESNVWDSTLAIYYPRHILENKGHISAECVPYSMLIYVLVYVHCRIYTYIGPRDVKVGGSVGERIERLEQHDRHLNINDTKLIHK